MCPDAFCLSLHLPVVWIARREVRIVRRAGAGLAEDQTEVGLVAPAHQPCHNRVFPLGKQKLVDVRVLGGPPVHVVALAHQVAVDPELVGVRVADLDTQGSLLGADEPPHHVDRARALETDEIVDGDPILIAVDQQTLSCGVGLVCFGISIAFPAGARFQIAPQRGSVDACSQIGYIMLRSNGSQQR